MPWYTVSSDVTTRTRRFILCECVYIRVEQEFPISPAKADWVCVNCKCFEFVQCRFMCFLYTCVVHPCMHVSVVVV